MELVESEVKEHIIRLGHLQGRFCLYILEVEPTYYKYGISEVICNRLCTHLHKLKFRRIINVFDCGSEFAMNKLEDIVEKLAEVMKERVERYNYTEIIHTPNIDYYLEVISRTLQFVRLNEAPANYYVDRVGRSGLLQLRKEVNELKQRVDPQPAIVINVDHHIVKNNFKYIDPIKAAAIDWVKQNLPGIGELTTDYYKKYEAATENPMHHTQFGKVVRNEGYEVGKSNGIRYWTKI